MVTGTDGDRLPVEQRGHVVGMDAWQREGHDARALGRGLRSVDADARDFPRQDVEGILGQGQLVGMDALHADRGEVVHGSTEPDGGGDVRRARLELVGHVVEGRVPELDGARPSLRRS